MSSHITRHGNVLRSNVFLWPLAGKKNDSINRPYSQVTTLSLFAVSLPGLMNAQRQFRWMELKWAPVRGSINSRLELPLIRHLTTFLLGVDSVWFFMSVFQSLWLYTNTIPTLKSTYPSLFYHQPFKLYCHLSKRQWLRMNTWLWLIYMG